MCESLTSLNKDLTVQINESTTNCLTKPRVWSYTRS